LVSIRSGDVLTSRLGLLSVFEQYVSVLAVFRRDVLCRRAVHTIAAVIAILTSMIFGSAKITGICVVLQKMMFN